jgi:ABC-type multidrug transport system ATPase subunit
MDSLMLNVRSVTKRYGRATALDRATFDLAPGEVTALVGANGAGKSTLIKAIVGLVRFEGQILVDGIDVARDGRKARRRIGYLAQHASFHPDLTVRETARFYAELRGESAETARGIVVARGLGEHEEKLVGALSGGLRQRLALAIAQFGDPSLLVLDEPSTGLDVTARLELRQFIRDQRQLGKTILLSTHWLEDVPSIADTAIVLEQGKVVFHGSADTFTVVQQPKSQLFFRLNGHTADAMPLLQRTGSSVKRTGDWLAVTCPAAEKAHVLESLVAAGISIKDFRLEEAVGATPAPSNGVHS